MNRRRRLPGFAAANYLTLAAALLVKAMNGADGAIPRIRIAASTSLVSTELNENDARAAIKTWASALTKEGGVLVEALPEVLSTPEQLIRSVRQGDLDAFSAPTTEYLQVAAYTDPTFILVDQMYVNGGEEYLILVHADSGIRTVAELRGRTLAKYSATPMNLASDWLDVLLAASNLGPQEGFFGPTISHAKVSRIVLPVFFRQLDACVVTRRTFDLMGEMNPQLVAKLRILATSPKVIPVIVAVHKNCPPSRKEAFRSLMVNLGASPSGRQILALFGSRQVMAAHPSILGPSIELLAAGSRVRARGAALRR
jgi:ABC-type phosphate/phosphonate transport system substrate-binding protein